jgi:hypothetical protein
MAMAKIRYSNKIRSEVVDLIKRIAEAPSPLNYVYQYSIVEEAQGLTKVIIEIIPDEHFMKEEISNG